MFGYFVIAIINPSRSKAETTILRCFSSILQILDSIVLKLIIVYCLYESHLCDSLSHTFLCCMCKSLLHSSFICIFKVSVLKCVQVLWFCNDQALFWLLYFSYASIVFTVLSVSLKTLQIYDNRLRTYTSV